MAQVVRESEALSEADEQFVQTLVAMLSSLSIQKQLAFWIHFRTKHQRRIASTEAQFCPALLRAVDAQIDFLTRNIT